MRRETVLQILREHTQELRNRGVASLSLFGSVARDEAGSHSDVDILIELDAPLGYFALVDIQLYLEQILGCRVDLTTPDALHPAMRATILREAVHAA